MLNKVLLQGRLTDTPVVKCTNSGKSVLSFSLAVERNMQQADGSRGCDFINIVAWGKTADFIGQYFTKGQQMLLDGFLQVRKYESKAGETRYATEVVVNQVFFCGSKEKPKATTFAEEIGAYADTLSEYEDLPF